MLSRPLSHGSNSSIRQVGPSALPCRGQVRRSVHGVRTRPMKYTSASARTGRSIASSPERTSFSRTIDRSIVEADHHVGRLDDGVGRLADFQAELIDRLVGDRGGDGGAIHIEPDMRGGRAFLGFENRALEPVSGADLHGGLLVVPGVVLNSKAAVAMHQSLQRLAIYSSRQRPRHQRRRRRPGGASPPASAILAACPRNPVLTPSLYSLRYIDLEP